MSAYDFDNLRAENKRLKADLEETIKDMMTLMDEHATDEVKMEARRRFIERFGETA